MAYKIIPSVKAEKGVYLNRQHFIGYVHVFKDDEFLYVTHTSVARLTKEEALVDAEDLAGEINEDIFASEANAA